MMSEVQMIVIIKKEVCKEWLSIKIVKRIPSITYPLVKFYYEIKGYEVEKLEDYF